MTVAGIIFPTINQIRNTTREAARTYSKRTVSVYAYRGKYFFDVHFHSESTSENTWFVCVAEHVELIWLAAR